MPSIVFSIYYVYKHILFPPFLYCILCSSSYLTIHLFTIPATAFVVTPFFFSSFLPALYLNVSFVDALVILVYFFPGILLSSS